MTSLPRRLLAEAVGTLMLVGAVIGSGILADRLSSDDAVSLLAKTLATAAMLATLILALGPVSGAHLNPVVTLVIALQREVKASAAVTYILAQGVGAVAGAMLAHFMFGMPLLQESTQNRSGLPIAAAEGVATFVLVLVVLSVRRTRPEAIAWAAALAITAGYWWTSSTSFANPAVTLARTLTDTFSGVRAADVQVFMLAQVAGAVVALAAFACLFGPESGDKRGVA